MSKITSRLTEQIEQILKETLGDTNLTEEAGQRLLGKEDRLRRDLRKVILSLSIDDGDTLSQQTAREIMGRNFLGIAEVTEHFRKVKPAELRQLAEIPFSEEVLRACAETHLLVADIGLSSHNLHLKSGGNKGEKIVFGRDTHPSYRDGEPPRWRLISKVPLEGSYSKTWEEQCGLVRQFGATVPSARQLTYAALLHWRALGEWPTTGRGRVSDMSWREDDLPMTVDIHPKGMFLAFHSEREDARVGVYVSRT